MKIIEWLKELKLIIKKIQSAQEQISKTNCLLSNEKPLIGSSDKEQTKEVHALIQSIFDLEQDYIQLKGRIESTNNNTRVTINGIERTITEWLTVLRTTYSTVRDTKRYLNTDRAQKMLTTTTNKEWITIIPCYDITKVNNIFNDYMSTVERISSTLEVVNATTEII